VGKIDAHSVANQRKESLQLIVRQSPVSPRWASGARRDVRMFSDPAQLHGDGARRKNEIDAACKRGAPRHAAVFGGRFILRKGDSTRGLHGAASYGAVGGSSRQDHGNRLIGSLV